MDYKNNSNTGLIIVADCMLLSVECIGNVHLFFNSARMVWPYIGDIKTTGIIVECVREYAPKHIHVSFSRQVDPM